MESQHLDLLKRLVDSKTEFTVIGGMAAVFYGSSIVTQDLDVCASLDEKNLPRILEALRGINPRFRMRPDRLPLPEEPERLHGFRNLCLSTDIGILDILGEVSGIGGFSEAIAQSHPAELQPGLQCHLLDLEALIAAKRAAGRPKDLRAVAELLVILDRRRPDASQGSLFE
jgi:hypothetical protein